MQAQQFPVLGNPDSDILGKQLKNFDELVNIMTIFHSIFLLKKDISKLLNELGHNHGKK